MRSHIPKLISHTPAAQYVRMSDEGQQYSIANQKTAIQEYADRNNFYVVKTYADAGKSGVALKHRTALRNLLQDVVSGNANYKAILVYDVSRWGRFPNNDEAAHYEFVCSSSGIPLHYCAEPFANDQTPSSSILKALKRSMAAEFSRELGDKVFRGKSRLAQMGFWVRGPAGYGYRRMMISADGKRRRQLKDGERKSLTTDRIILVPGPQKEIDCVRHMFSMVIEGRHGAAAIARDLNRRGITCYGNRWTEITVHNVLTNPKYKGWNVWHRRTLRLHTKRLDLASDQWITKPGAFAPLVGQETFEQAQKMLPKREDNWWTDNEILSRLKRLFKAKGRLSERLILDARGMPTTSTLHRRFGSYRQIYKMVGYHFPPEDVFKSCERWDRTMRLRRKVVRQILEMFPNRVSVTHLPGRSRSILKLADGTMTSVLLCRTTRQWQRRLQWLVIPNPAEHEFVTLLCRLNPRHDRIDSYYVFPSRYVRYHRLHKDDPWLAEGIKLNSLSEFLATVETIRIRGDSAAGPG